MIWAVVTVTMSLNAIYVLYGIIQFPVEQHQQWQFTGTFQLRRSRHFLGVSVTCYCVGEIHLLHVGGGRLVWNFIRLYPVLYYRIIEEELGYDGPLSAVFVDPYNYPNAELFVLYHAGLLIGRAVDGVSRLSPHAFRVTLDYGPSFEVFFLWSDFSHRFHTLPEQPNAWSYFQLHPRFIWMLPYVDPLITPQIAAGYILQPLIRGLPVLYYTRIGEPFGFYDYRHINPNDYLHARDFVQRVAVFLGRAVQDVTPPDPYHATFRVQFDPEPFIEVGFRWNDDRDSFDGLPGDPDGWADFQLHVREIRMAPAPYP